VSHFFTIGHSNHTLARFVELLQAHIIETLVDVRSSPYSRLHPQFNREALAVGLKKSGMAYKFMGDRLGGRSDDPSCYKNGRVDYEAVAKTDYFTEGLRTLVELGTATRLTLMCAEREPIECHRTLLVSRCLAESGYEIWHIHADGFLEAHEEALRRLVAMAGNQPDQIDLFRTQSDIEAEAYARQASRVGYVDPRFSTASEGAVG
jgi:uncharacterized protein (DUF488 family)